jgi:hypothetical protein
VNDLSLKVATLSTQRQAHSAWGKSPMLLHIEVEDPNSKSRRRLGDPTVICLNPLKTLDRPDLRARFPDQRSIRMPAISPIQFDSLVTERVWSGKIGNEDNLSPEEVGVGILFGDLFH